MKRILVIFIICCLAICPILAASGCSMSSTPNEIAKNYENVAKGYSVDAKKGGEGDSATFEFKGQKTFNSIVLKEKGDNITNYELCANGEMIYKSDFIGKYKYCSFKTVTASSVTLKVVGCDKEWSIKDFEAYDISNTATDNFEVMSYLIVDRAYKFDEDTAELLKHTTQFNLFGSVFLDKDGRLHFQDFIIDGESVEGKTALAKAVENVRKYNPNATIVFTVLGNLDMQGDGLDTQGRHTQAMGKNADTLVKECIDVMQEFSLDGISFDYEYPHTIKANNTYGKFLEKLKKAMPDGKKLSAAFSIWNLTVAGCFPHSKLKYLDTLEIMTYDGFDDRGNHASFYEMCANAMYKLKSKGIDMSKVHLGLPFYSRPADGAAYWGDYAGVAQNLGVWNNSLIEEINVDGKVYQQTCYYNCRQMIYDKTCYALDIKLGGVMIWHFTCDTTDSELSLYGAISDAIQSRK